MDASRGYEDNPAQNKLREHDVDHIVNVYRNYNSVEKYAHRATIEEIKENDYNLSIPRYVDTFEEEEQFNLIEVKNEIEELESILNQTKEKIKENLREFGL
ncbi:MAG: N-6 DNA methylase [Candidatus Hodarchaeales archaeon]